MTERSVRLRTLMFSPAWKDLNELIKEVVQAMSLEALSADTDEDAARLIQEARVAQKFGFKFMQLVENTAQPGEEN